MPERVDVPWYPKPGVDDAYVLFPKEHVVEADDGTPIAYTIHNASGTGLPLLLANGWSCSDAYWGPLVERFEAAGHPCIIPDTRGHGASGLPRDPGRGAANLRVEDVSMARIARDLVAVLDDSGFDRAVVVGHSMGVQSTLEVERLIPDRTLALVLVAGTYENPARTFYGTGLADLGFPIVAGLFRWFPEIAKPVQATIGPAGFGHWAARLARAAGPASTAEDLHPYLLHLKHADVAVMMLTATAMRDHSAADLLPHIDTPTLIVAAGSDVFTPARCSEQMHHRIPASELVTFPDAGHTLPIEHPDEIAAALDEFLARRVDPPRRRRATTGRGARTATRPKPKKAPASKRAGAKEAAAKRAAGEAATKTTPTKTTKPSTERP